MLADRFGYTVDEICELTIDAALILLSDGKDPGKKTMTARTEKELENAMRKLHE